MSSSIRGDITNATSVDRRGFNAKVLTDTQKQRLDPGMRLVLRLLADRDWQQLAWRTGLVVSPANAASKKLTLPLPIILKFANNEVQTLGVVVIAKMLSDLGVEVVGGWFNELAKNSALHRMPGVLFVDAANPAIMPMPDAERVEDRLRKILGLGFVTGIGLSGQHLPLLEKSLNDIGMPANATYKGRKLTGKGIVVGIIDDGCPFAHQDFLVRTGSTSAPTFSARTVRLWDQSAGPVGDDLKRGWISGSFGYGREITAADIDAAINAPVAPVKPHVTPQGWIEEEAIYNYLNYPMGRAGKRASHGSRVMGIAAGNGRSVMGWPGVAPEADVVFVQLPETLINLNTAVLTNSILDGIEYIFDYAASKGQAAVVNISYGGYAHAHDGSSYGEVAIDELLALPDRCVVVSAGNGFEADCHASGTVAPYKTVTREWLIKPEDPTPNDVEIWYDGNANVLVSLIPPDRATVYGPYALGVTDVLKRPADKLIIGRVDHWLQDNGDGCGVFWLRPTGEALPGLSLIHI